MNKRKILNYGIILVTILLGIILIFIPYLLNSRSFLIGSDSGSYVFELQKYLNSSSLPDNISLWQEPGMFMLLKEISLFTGINARGLFLFLQGISLILIILLAYLILKKIKDNEYEPIALFLIISSTILLNAFFLALYRQLFATVLFLMIIYITIRSNLKKISIKAILIILLSFLFITHRAMSMIIALTLITLSLKEINKKEKSILKDLLIILCISLFFSMPYYLPQLKTNITIFFNSIFNSINTMFHYNRQNLGRSLVSDYHNVNPLLDYVYSNSLIAILGISSFVLLFLKNKIKIPLSVLTILLFIWTGFSLVFGNRIIILLDLIMILFFSFVFRDSFKKISKLIVFFLLIITLLIGSVNLSLNKKAYLPEDTPGLDFINNLSRENSIIIAPNALQVIFAQMGYDTLMTQKIFEKTDSAWMTNTDKFLINGYNNYSLINNYLGQKSRIYVIITDWYINNPVSTQTSEKVNISKWDNSQDYSIIYKGEGGIIRVYEYKNGN